MFAHWDILNKENVIGANAALHAMDGFDPTYDTLVDFRGISKVDLNVHDLTEVLEAIKNTDKRTGLAALVVGNNLGRFALAKFFCSLSARFSRPKVRYKAFRTVDEAVAWLDSDR